MGGTQVSPAARQQYLQQMRDRYAVAGRRARSALLDEAGAMTGYHRKALIRRFTRPLGPRRRRRGRPRRYGTTVVAALRALWRAAGYPWSVRLKALLPVWLPRARTRLHLTPAVEAQLGQISPRQMDRASPLTKNGPVVLARRDPHRDHDFGIAVRLAGAETAWRSAGIILPFRVVTH